MIQTWRISDATVLPGTHQDCTRFFIPLEVHPNNERAKSLAVDRDVAVTLCQAVSPKSSTVLLSGLLPGSILTILEALVFNATSQQDTLPGLYQSRQVPSRFWWRETVLIPPCDTCQVSTRSFLHSPWDYLYCSYVDNSVDRLPGSCQVSSVPCWCQGSCPKASQRIA